MTTLDESQIGSYREDSGDTDATPYVSNTAIQAFYDAATLMSTDTDTVYAITMVRILTRMLGKLARLTDLGGQVENEKRSQWFDHIKDMLLPYWEGKAGLDGAYMDTGDLALNLDTDCDDLTVIQQWLI